LGKNSVGQAKGVISSKGSGRIKLVHVGGVNRMPVTPARKPEFYSIVL